MNGRTAFDPPARTAGPGSSVYFPLALVILAFGIVYAFSLSFVYVEGDDAASIAFHALGRQASLQPPYAPYHGMMDTVLRLAPPVEPVLRLTAIILSATAAVSLVALMLLLVFDWVDVKPGPRRIVAALAILAITPEFYYLGLVYTPSSVALSLALASHLLVRRVAQRRGRDVPRAGSSAALVCVSLLLFGFGVACRWDIGAYWLVIVTDLLIGGAKPSGAGFNLKPRRRLMLTACWGVLAIVAVLGAVAVSGYGLSDIYQVRRQASQMTTQGEFSLATLARIYSFFTPALLLLAAVGYIGLLRRRRSLAVVAAVGILPIIPFLYKGIPKMLLPAVPGLVLAVVHGFNTVWFAAVGVRQLVVIRLLLAGAIAAPWLVGIRVYSPDTAWGPGFEITPPSPRVKPEGEEAMIVDYRETGRRLAAGRVALTFGGGFAVPTQEGPRPLGGHAAVLLGGRWRELVCQIDRERRDAIRRAIDDGLPILQDDGNALLIVHLIELGFQTREPTYRFSSSGIASRRCYNTRGEEVTTYSVHFPTGLWNAAQLDDLTRISNKHTFVLFCGYSSTLRRLVEIEPDALQVLGPFSAVVDVKRLRGAIPWEDGTRARP